MPTTSTTVSQLCATFAAGRSPKVDQLDRWACDITDPNDALTAFMAIPARPEFAFARITLLRRLWLLKDAFLKNSFYQEQFDRKTLTEAEYHKMVQEFGQAPVVKFFTPQRNRRNEAACATAP